MSAEPAPDLIVATGGAWAVAPRTRDRARHRRRGPAARRAVAIAFDHARLLGPLGLDPRRERAPPAHRPTSPTTSSRRSASVVIPAGIRAGRSAGRVTVHADGGHEPSSSSSRAASSSSTCRPASGPPPRSTSATPSGSAAAAGTFAVDVAGGLGGLLLDLRDVPLRLPDRPERRRELLEAWQDSLWVTRDR